MSHHEEFNKPLNKNYNANQIDNCSFNSSDFISKPIKSKRCTINENIVQLQYPFK